MVKLIVTYSHGDGCTYSASETIPIEYESGEALLVDLEDHVKYTMRPESRHEYGIDEFLSTGIYASELVENGVYYPPTVRTLEEWWEDEAYHSR